MTVINWLIGKMQVMWFLMVLSNIGPALSRLAYGLRF